MNFMKIQSMFLALVEPQIDFTNEQVKNVFIILKEFSIKDFFENIWCDEIKNKRNKLLELIHLNHYQHPLIRNYLELIKKKLFHLQLVQKYKDGDNEYVILHTYKLNIFKRIWRNKRINRNL